MPRTTLCAVCNGHNATNYQLKKFDRITELGGVQFSVNAGSIDLCDSCWNRLINRRTLTLEGIQERLINRRATILARHAHNG